MFDTKYRPKKFSEYLGSKIIAEAVRKSVYSQNVPHAFFFYGPRGVGKTTIARLIAKALNCQETGARNRKVEAGNDTGSSKLEKTKSGPQSPNSQPLASIQEPCGVCDNCIAIDNGSFIDLIEIDAASNRGIDDIRAVKDKISLAPSIGKYKVYIVDEVHMLTPEAFNALLKTLEEPPAHAVFILCTTEYKKVPETIKSRCQKFELKRATISDITEKLERIVENEKKEGAELKNVTGEEIKKIAKAALGGFRDAETMLEQVVTGQVSVDQLASVSDSEGYYNFLKALLVEKNLRDSVNTLNKFFESGVSAEAWVDGLLEYLQNLIYANTIKESAEEVPPEMLKISLSAISKTIKVYLLAKSQIKYATVPYLPLIAAVIDVIETEETSKPSEIEPTPTNNGSPKATAAHQDTKKEASPKSSEPPVKASEKKSPTLEVSKTPSLKVNFSMDKLYEAVRPLNHSVEALLRSCKVLGIDDNNNLQIEAFYSFHKERLSSPTNRKILEDALNSIMGEKIGVVVTLGKKAGVKEDLSDKNVDPTPLKEAQVVKEAWEILDGNAPI